MTAFFTGVAMIFVVLLSAGLLLLCKSPSRAEKVLATQLIATLCVALLLVMMVAVGDDTLCDVALVFSLLAALTTIAFVNKAWRTPSGGQHHVRD